MDKLNILLISYEFPPMVGGEGSYVYGLSKALSDLGHKINIVTIYQGRKGMNSNNGNCNFIQIPILKKPPGFKMMSFGYGLNIKLKELIKTQKLDVIHQTYDFYKIPFSKEDVDAPVFATIHHPFIAEQKAVRAFSNFYDYFKYRILKRSDLLAIMQKKICERVDKIIAVSNFTAQNVIDDYAIPPTKIEVIPNGVDLNKFNPKVDGIKMRGSLGITDEPVILYVGKLEFNKGIEYLILSFSKIVKQIPNAKLVIVGNGPIKNRLMNLVKQKKLSKSVIFTGKIPSKKLPSIFAASDLFVLPSLMEGFGIVLLEAMACGKPCIATKAGGTEDIIVNGETGFLAPIGDCISLYQAINALLANPDLAQKFGKAGLNRVRKNFTWNIIAKRTINTYRNII